MSDQLSLVELTQMGAQGGVVMAGVFALLPGALTLWRLHRARRAVASWAPWAEEHGWTHEPGEGPQRALMRGAWRGGSAEVEAWSFEEAGRFETAQLSIAYSPAQPLPAGLLIAPANALDRKAIPPGVFRVGLGDAAFDRAFLVLGADVPTVQALLTYERRQLLLAARSSKLEWTFKHDAFRLLLSAPVQAVAVASLLDELADLSDRFIAAT